MEAHRLQLKIYVAADSVTHVDPEAFIGVFHRWIKEHVLAELLIDVASYIHVPQGPAVALIGHGTDYFLDFGEGRLGLVHNRKRAAPMPENRLADLFRRTLHAALLLERDPALSGKLRFATDELLFRINDRLATSDPDATFTSVKPEIDAFARRIYGGPVTLVRSGGPKDIFSVRITSSSAPTLAALIERAGGPPEPDASIVV